MDTHEDLFNAWRLLYAPVWNRYQNPQYPDQSEANRVILMAQAEKYRASITAFNRALSEVKDDLMRLDGKSDSDDAQEAKERAAQRETEEEANTVVTDGDYLYVASLTKAQVSEAYFADQRGEFARVYRSLMRTHGFQAPAPLAVSR